MVIMLAVCGVVFGGVFGFIVFRQHMMKQFFANMPKPVVAVTATAARESEWREVVPAVGTLQAVNGVDVAGSAAGLIRDISFQSGQEVRRGQPLVRLDTDVEMGDLRSAQAELELARTGFNRTQTLIRSNTVSQSALEKAEAELSVKTARVAGLQAMIGRKTVSAPFDGVLGVRKVDLGQYLQPGQAIVNLQDLTLMLCDFSVSQKELAALGVGEPVRLTTDAWPGRLFEGVVAAIEPLVDARTGMVAVQARFPNPDRVLRPGMFARIEIIRPTGQRVVTVPASAVSYNLHGDAVFVVRTTAAPDGKPVQLVERAVVELGDRRDGLVVVRRGLAAGELVVTSGQIKLENGSHVEVSSETPLGGAAEASLR
jgi:membrane fusion protein (multidrug efflux system)